MAFSLGEYQDIFLEEADEQLQELNQNLLELENNPDDLEIINNIFRAAHSLKSSAAFVGLNDLSDLAHKMENLLQGIREKTLDLSAEVIDIIFKCFDVINSVINTIAAGEEPKQDLRWIIDEIQAVGERSDVTETENVVKEKDDVDDVAKEGAEIPRTILATESRKKIKKGLESGISCCEITIFINKEAQMKWVKAQLVLNNLGKLGHIVVTIPSAEDLSDDRMNNIFKIILLTNASIDEIRKASDIDLIGRVDIKSISLTKKDDKLVLKFGENEIFIGSDEEADYDSEVSDKEYKEEKDLGIKDDKDVEETEEEDEEIISIQDEMLETGKMGTAQSSVQDKRRISVLKTVKVSIDKLDILLNNVGELVIANSGFYKLYEEIRKISGERSFAKEFKSRMEQMSRIAKDLQTGIMKTRMVPIGQVLSRFKRLIRDLAKEFDKKVDLIIKGEETELDKKVIDSIGEPLLHLLRNAIDHGIEPASERKKIGKSETAHVTLKAYQGGNQIFVEVSDDGRGLNIENIKKKVVKMGLATAEMLSGMGDSEIYNFIFNPGFSTAEKVTDISGRGVGMNVVEEIVNELNGTVAIETEFGMGTRFVLSFPLTLAIIPAIMTKVRNDIFAIPLNDVIETIKISQSDITTIEGHEVINLRGEILSLLRLNRFIKLKSALKEGKKIPVVVVGFGNRKIGLIVDYLEGKQEIVIKSLEQNYRTVEGFAGASILGDGSICLILDINSMINKVIVEQDRLPSYKMGSIIEAEETEIEEIDEEIEPVAEPDEMVMETKEIKDEKVSIPEPDEEVIELEEMSDEKIKSDSIDSGIVSDKKSETVSIDEEAADDIGLRVRATLDDFRKELRESIKSTVETGGPSEHMVAAMNLSNDDLNEFQVIANSGATNAAESLSKIINKRIDLSIPEVTVKPIEQIPKHIGDIDSIYMGVMMPIVGDAPGTVLFIFKEDIGFELIDLLYGIQVSQTKALTEDGESALQELTNIVGSSIINIFAEKTGLVIKPGVPTIVHDYLQSVLDSILILHTIENDYAIVMDTAFYFEDDKIIGNLLLLPEAESLKMIVERMRSNVR